MTTFANSLKSEIARIARKELKAELFALKKTSAGHRSEIAALKREVKALRAQVKTGQRVAKASAPATDARDAKKPGRKPGFSAKAFAAHRAKLGLTQAQMAQLLDVSTLSVSKWESGKVQPRAAQLERIVAVREMGKREAAGLLIVAN
jgi:DNA-binding transcriptional regulator YiaG